MLWGVGVGFGLDLIWGCGPIDERRARKMTKIRTDVPRDEDVLVREDGLRVGEGAGAQEVVVVVRVLLLLWSAVPWEVYVCVCLCVCV